MGRKTSLWAAFSILLFLFAGVLALTTDQAKAQSSTTQPPTVFTSVSISFCDLGHGWALARPGTILVTRDGGANWELRLYGNFVGRAVQFLDPSRGWIAGSNGTILATTDGGAAWKPQLVRSSIMVLESVHFVDTSHGWVVGTDGTISATTDGGGSWSQQSSGTTATLNSVYFVDPNHGWAVGLTEQFWSRQMGARAGASSPPASRRRSILYILLTLTTGGLSGEQF